jgi:hypothetical protein
MKCGREKLSRRPFNFVLDWDAGEDDLGLVYHKPTKLLFRVACTAPDDGAPIPQSALFSRVAHVCDGAQLPPMDELQRIGKDAIQACIIFAHMPLLALRRHADEEAAGLEALGRAVLQVIRALPSYPDDPQTFPPLADDLRFAVRLMGSLRQHLVKTEADQETALHRLNDHEWRFVERPSRPLPTTWDHPDDPEIPF